jgi:hypothetical protein
LCLWLAGDFRSGLPMLLAEKYPERKSALVRSVVYLMRMVPQGLSDPRLNEEVI